MGQKRHSEEQIIEILRDGDTGLTVAEICRKHSISDATYYKWKKRYGGVDKTELRRLRELEKENDDLKNEFQRIPPYHCALIRHGQTLSCLKS